jgi:hypothetical protein
MTRQQLVTKANAIRKRARKHMLLNHDELVGHVIAAVGGDADNYFIVTEKGFGELRGRVAFFSRDEHLSRTPETEVPDHMLAYSGLITDEERDLLCEEKRVSRIYEQEKHDIALYRRLKKIYGAKK